MRRILALCPVAGAALLSLAAAAPAPDGKACEALANLKISAAEIGLPSRGATIASAVVDTVPADPTSPTTSHPICKVLGAIAPIDPKAPPINFEVNLPLQWNGKSVQYGGGGFNGVLISGLNPLPSARPSRPTPVAQGYMTLGTDSGHDNATLAEIQAFALNDEALTNFAYAAYKKVHDAGVRIAAAFYSRAPEKAYYVGSSEGGREGLTMAQRFPNDFDGIVSIVPVINWTGLQWAGARSGVVQRNGGWLSANKLKAINLAVNASCDTLDGLADGIISAYEACAASNPAPALCAGGADTGDDCLSQSQLAAFDTLHSYFTFPFALANGVTSYPYWNFGGEAQQGGMTQWVTGAEPAQFPLPPRGTPGQQWRYGNGALRYFYARDAKADPMAMAPEKFSARIREISALMDSTDPDLSAFAAHGGKLILKEHGADFAQSPFAGIAYYKSVIAAMGAEKTDSFLHFYVTPGINHGGAGVMANGTPIPGDIDLLAVLDSWATAGSPPGELVQLAEERRPPFRALASRPLCRYPLYPRYDGKGDPNAAASFVCTKQ